MHATWQITWWELKRQLHNRNKECMTLIYMYSTGPEPLFLAPCFSSNNIFTTPPYHNSKYQPILFINIAKFVLIIIIIIIMVLISYYIIKKHDIINNIFVFHCVLIDM